MIHITVKQKGQEPRPRRCHADAALFTCPFCTTDACKPRQYHQIMTHIAGHKLRAVEYGDHVIYSCNIGCGKKGKHFHCCKCPKTYINKGAMKKHLCSAHPIATCTPEPQPVGHPLQEPPSQRQPASHPPLEPPSQQRLASHSSPEPTSQQQPASHSLQEPPSQQQAASQPSPKPPSQQQAGSQPKELESQQAAPPAIGKMQSSVQCPSRHITIKLKGQEPRPRRCRTDATLFTCPFCTTDVCKPRQYYQIMTHIAGHKLRAVEYGDHVIYSCNIGCGKKARHFHCCKCPKTYINKGAIKKHLCSAHPITISSPEPQPVIPPEPPSQQQPASHSPPEPPLQKQPVSHSKELDLQQAAPHPQELTASPAIEKKHVSVQCPHRHITVKQKGQEPRPRRCHADATLFTCPFCTTEVCKPRQYHQIMTHIAGHKLRAVEYWR
ncbi:protein piccolo isoform X2 [Labeo rohita]|uniref:protein piccolo isoform X2 n=1 Tax=Labeo rohita TaxID=84645 RepID=UPI0021E24A44|nr:protein piccolo isoform X2 [Labeo rohita]